MQPATLATRVYLQIAHATAAILGTHELVESVLLRRSVAAGEVSFGRSDIDLALVIGEEAADSRALISLLRRFRALRTIFPRLGECQVYDHLDLRTWWWTDTYRGSIDRRAARLLRGRPLSVPAIPVQRTHAANRGAFWLDDYLPVAFHKRNLRNLRKFAVEIWNAYATAKGIIDEPLIRRSEAARLWREHSEGQATALMSDDPRRLLALSFEVLKQFHALLLPPCPPMREATVLRVRWPPAYHQRLVIIVPDHESELPAEATAAGALLFTPEALQMYLEFVNPFAQWEIPPETGIGRVSPEAWLRACRDQGASWRTRSPGFSGRHTAKTAGRIIVAREALKFLRDGQTPPAIGDEAIARILAAPQAVARYYREAYPWLRDECGKLWAGLDEIADSTNPASATSNLSVIRSQS
jgi:hypothetical protein